MSKTKTKANLTTLAGERLNQLATQVGMTLMAAATITGMLELPNHPNSRVVLPGQPVFAWANENDELNNPVRREKEESAPHFISYAISQRTVPRASKK
jgi:hypothetical protein